MHAPYEPATGFDNLSFDAILRFDGALRRARQRVFGANQMTDSLWTVLTELATSENGLAFEGLEAGLGKAMGRQMLLAALSDLQEAGLIFGLKDEGGPLLSHMRVAPQGFSRIDEVIGAALVIARRR
jgi:hypothetical protein